MLVGKDWEKCGMTKNGHSESFWTTLVGKDEKNIGQQKLSIVYVFVIKMSELGCAKKFPFYILLAIFMFWMIGY